MSLEVVSNVKFINVYVVQRTYSFSSAKSYTSTNIGSITFPQNEKPLPLENLKIVPYNTSTPPNLVEVYLNEGEAVQRAEQLANIQDKYPYISKISTRKYLGVTCDEGKTVSLIDAVSTFNVSSIA